MKNDDTTLLLVSRVLSAEMDLFLTSCGRRKIRVWPLDFETSDVCVCVHADAYMHMAASGDHSPAKICVHD